MRRDDFVVLGQFSQVVVFPTVHPGTVGAAAEGPHAVAAGTSRKIRRPSARKRREKREEKREERREKREERREEKKEEESERKIKTCCCEDRKKQLLEGLRGRFQDVRKTKGQQGEERRRQSGRKERREGKGREGK